MPLPALQQIPPRIVALVATGVLLLSGCYIDNDAPVESRGSAAVDLSQVKATIASSCLECGEKLDLTILWRGSEEAEGYFIYYGPESETATRLIGGGPAENIFTVPLTISAGEQMCFRITAYTGYLESDFSPAVCVRELFHGGA